MTPLPAPISTAQPRHQLLSGERARLFLSTFQFHSNGHFQTPFEAANALEENWKILLDPPWRLNTAGRQAKDFLTAVDVHFKEEHSVKFYTGRLNLCESNLRKACQKALQCKPLRCIHLRLVLEAIQLLESTDLQVQEICRDLGFDEPSNFSRFLKDNTGWQPTQFRGLLEWNGRVAF